MGKWNELLIPCLFLATASAAQTKLSIPDTRTIPTTPASYNASFEPHFKDGTILGLSNSYYTVLGLRGWVDNSGGKAHELAFGPEGIHYRSGYEPGWDSWRSLLISDASGRFGIGTDMPIEKLTIRGGNVRVDRGFGYLLNYASLSETYNGASTILGNNVIAGDGADRIKRTVNPYDNGSFLALNYYYGITFHTGVNSPQNMEVPVYDSEKMRITQAGDVGIGTATPMEKLHVEGSQLLNGNLNFANDQTAYFINGRGNGGAIRLRSNVGADLDRNVQFGNIDNNGNWNSYMIVASGGNVGIGTLSPNEKLSVNGKIRAREVKVEPTIGWPDYVFEDTYRPKALKEIEAFIKVNKHLPEVPSAMEVQNNGIELGEMNKVLLKKIEELTLYLIEKEKELKATNDRIDHLSEIVKQLITTKTEKK